MANLQDSHKEAQKSQMNIATEPFVLVEPSIAEIGNPVLFAVCSVLAYRSEAMVYNAPKQ